jgi:hypothetical protein
MYNKMSQQNKSTLQSAINTDLADNTSGDISAADVRDNLINMTDSLLFNSGSQGITGSLEVTEGITGSLQGTATTASYVETAQTASFVVTAQTASYVENAQTASFVELAQTASYVENAQTASFVELAQTASYVETAQTASFVELAQTASFVELAQTASYVENAVSASYAQTASYVNPLNQEVILTGNITASGDLRLTTAGNAVVRPIIDLTPNGTASYSPNSTNTTAYANYGINVITTATATDYCLRLPQTPVEGKSVTIVNNSGINIVLFPSVIGGSINGVIDGFEIIPSDGKSYTFDCYENPLPGGWSLSTSPSSGNTTISTGEINWAYTSSSDQIIAYVNDSIKATGGGISAYPPNLGPYITNQYQAGNYQWSFGGTSYTYTFAQILPDTIPGQGVWKSIDSLQIQTNITGVLANSFNFSYSQGNNSEFFYNPSNPNYLLPNSISPWTGTGFFTDPSYISFNTNVRTPWFASRPGTQGQFNGSGGGGYTPSTFSIVPGTFTPSLASPYTSDNIGDPGTFTLTINNFPAYLNSMGLRWIGRNFIGSFYHPTEGLIDSWYTQTVSPFFAAVVGTPFIPNIKFNTTFNVQI